MLDVLSNLLLAQAKECLLEKLLLPAEKMDLGAQLDIGQEAAQVGLLLHGTELDRISSLTFVYTWFVGLPFAFTPIIDGPSHYEPR